MTRPDRHAPTTPTPIAERVWRDLLSPGHSLVRDAESLAAALASDDLRAGEALTALRRDLPEHTWPALSLLTGYLRHRAALERDDFDRAASTLRQSRLDCGPDMPDIRRLARLLEGLAFGCHHGEALVEADDLARGVLPEDQARDVLGRIRHHRPGPMAIIRSRWTTHRRRRALLARGVTPDEPLPRRPAPTPQDVVLP